MKWYHMKTARALALASLLLLAPACGDDTGDANQDGKGGKTDELTGPFACDALIED